MYKQKILNSYSQCSTWTRFWDSYVHIPT